MSQVADAYLAALKAQQWLQVAVEALGHVQDACADLNGRTCPELQALEAQVDEMESRMQKGRTGRGENRESPADSTMGARSKF